MKRLIISLLLHGVLVKDVFLMSTKTWLRNINFNNSLNWDLGRVPCSQDNVIFPRTIGFIIELPDGETILRQLVLPLYGEVVLPLSGILQMSNPNENDNKCQGKDITFSHRKSSSWMDPKSWTGHNSATPDLEAIPCATDNVVFPPKASFSVVMPNTEIHVGALSIAGKQFQSSDWSDLMLTDEGHWQFFTENDRNMPDVKVTGRLCTDISGCDCNNEQLKEDVCNLIRSECRNTPCLDPVTPYGNCCPICGAYLLFKYNEKFSKAKFENYLEDKISNMKIDFHVSKVHGKIQVVLFEKERYQEKVQSLADEIFMDIMKRSDLGLSQNEQHVAGALVTPINLTKQAYIFLGFMFVAICTIGVLFYSYTDACKISIQEGGHYGFAIFQNQSEEVELYGPNGSTKKSTKSSQRQAFDNPMYGSTSEVDRENQDTSEECPIYSMLEEIKLEKDGYEDQVESVDDMLNASN